MAAAISMGWAVRCSALMDSTRVRRASSFQCSAIIGVSVAPGASVFTQMPCGASARAAFLVRASTAPLLAA